LFPLLREECFDRQRLFGVDDRFERFVLDLHQFGGIIGQARRFRNYRGYRLSLVADLFTAIGVVANLLSLGPAPISMKGCVWAATSLPVIVHTTPATLRSRCIDADDAGVRIRRAHEAEIRHFAKLDVVGELAPAAQQPVFFFARKRSADPRLAPFFFLPSRY
jgi:hypothetical protein